MLIGALRRTLVALARNQSAYGQIPSLAHDPRNRGASDSTPLFLLALGLYRRVMQKRSFLRRAADRALLWIAYQRPDDDDMVAQLPTSDWRDEQFVFGHGLYLNALVYAALRLLDRPRQAARLAEAMLRYRVRDHTRGGRIREGLALPGRPHLAFYGYKVYGDDRLDLLGNSLAIVTGLVTRTRARRIIGWIEAHMTKLRRSGDLALELPPCLFPYIRPGDPDWRPRYQRLNRPGEYHNGGVWPFAAGLYVAACIAARRKRLARRRLLALTAAVRPSRERTLPWGFNEWLKAQTAAPGGRDWQTWSASTYLYATACVQLDGTPYFDWVREG